MKWPQFTSVLMLGLGITACGDLCLDEGLGEERVRTSRYDWHEKTPLDTGQRAMDRVRATLRPGVTTRWPDEEACWSAPIEDIQVEIIVRERYDEPIVYSHYMVRYPCDEYWLDHAKVLTLPVEVEVLVAALGFRAVNRKATVEVADTRIDFSTPLTVDNLDLIGVHDLPRAEVMMLASFRPDSGDRPSSFRIVMADWAQGPGPNDCLTVASGGTAQVQHMWLLGGVLPSGHAPSSVRGGLLLGPNRSARMQR